MVAGTDPRRPEDFDRDFEELVSGLDMSGSETESSRPRTIPGADFTQDSSGQDSSGRDHSERDDAATPPPERQDWFRMDEAIENATPDPEPEPRDSEWKPRPLPPMSRPSLLVATGWLCFSYCVATVLLTIVGVGLPPWMGYLAVFAFVAAIAILIWRLPRNSGPRDGDGAVV